MHCLHIGHSEAALFAPAASPYIALERNTTDIRTQAREKTMNHVLSTTSGAFSDTIATLAGKLATTVSNTAEQISLHIQYRRTVRELSQLTPRELADLGLNATNIRATAHEA